MKTPVLLFVVLLLVGCTSGKSFSPAAIQKVQLGMSSNEVVEIAGEPLRRGLLPDGRESWVWDYNNGFVRTFAAIIFRDGKVIEAPGGKQRYTPAEFQQQLTANELELKRLEREARALAEKKEEDRRQKTAQTQREEYANSHPERPAQILKCIRDQAICPGMTEAEVLISWGRPWRKNKSGGASGSFDQWVYGEDRYVYFRNGVLTSWQVSE